MVSTLQLSTTELAVLGFIAGFTIFLGLPIGRLRSPAPRLRVVLNAIAIGVLVFLLFDVLSHANEPVEAALENAVDDNGSWWRFVGLGAVFVLGLGIGLVGLACYDGLMTRRLSARSAELREPGAARRPGSPWSPAKRLAMMIAVGIGLHNFAEGLAIGQSAAAGDISLALLLIIGFGLHNATEGFGIVAPLAADGERASWAFLALVGVVGGGPTFVGTLIGRSFVNDTVFLAFLALAAGSIIFVVIQLLNVADRQGHPVLVTWGILGGLIAGLATDYILVAAGA
jgi:zinc transporter, ZIP family